MSGRRLSDDDDDDNVEDRTPLLGRDAGGSDSGSRRTPLLGRDAGGSEYGSRRTPLLKPQPSSSGGGSNDEDDDTESTRPLAGEPHPVRPRRCSVSTVLTIIVLLVILSGVVVFLILSPPADKDNWVRRGANQTETTAAPFSSLNATLSLSTDSNDNSDDYDEEGSKKVAIPSYDYAADEPPRVRVQPMTRRDRIEHWFMKRPKRSLTDYVLVGNRPEKYEVYLRAYVRGWNGDEKSRIDGEVNITLTHTGGNPRRIELNNLHSLIIHVVLYAKGEENLLQLKSTFTIDKKRERLAVESAQDLKEGATYMLQILYRSIPDLRMRGAYESWLWNEAAQKKVFSLQVNSQPMDARRWLPCFDEPQYKAKLSMIIEHPSGLTAVANSGVATRIDFDKQNRTITSFLQTVPLPSYLYAFSLNDYERFSRVEDGVLYASSLGRRQLEFGNRTLEFLINAVKTVRSLYPGWLVLSPAIGTNYTEKIDIIWTPDHSGAIENHGVILADDGKLLAGVADRVTNHEIAHHIFGNRLTLSWWSSVWLNEGLTTKVEYEAECVKLFGHLGEAQREILEEIFFAQRCLESMRTDIYETSAPLTDPEILTREESKQGFANAYGKGAAVLRMLQVFDADAYNRTIQELLSTRSFASFDQRDFCGLLSDFSRSKATQDICNDFSLKSNYPILSVQKVKGGYEVRQQRFHRGFVDPTYRDNDTRWTIPLTIRWKLPHSASWGEAERQIMWRDDETIFIEADAPIAINGDGQFYYRVIYDDYTPFYAMKPTLQADRVWRLLNYKLLDDSTAAMLTGYLSPTVALNFAANSGLSIPNPFFDEQFKVLLSHHLFDHGIFKWRPMDLVGQLFEPSNEMPAAWTEWEKPESVCIREGVNTPQHALDKYTKGDYFGHNTETLYLLECAGNSSVSHKSYIDWTWSALSATDGTVRAKDVYLVFQAAVTVLRNVDLVMRKITHKAYDVKISDDDFIYIISRLFSYMQAPINGVSISHLVQLRPEAMGAEWGTVARVVEEERMNDLEFRKLGPGILDALFTVLHKERGFDLKKLKPVEKRDEQPLEYTHEEMRAYSDAFAYPSQEGGLPFRRRRQHRMRREMPVEPPATPATNNVSGKHILIERSSGSQPPMEDGRIMKKKHLE